MVDDDRLDGNAVNGLFDEIFRLEITLARIICAGCGRTDLLGPLPASTDAPGVVIR